MIDDPVWLRGDTEVRWLAGALWLRSGDTALLVDAPSGVERRLPELALTALVLTSGRIEAIGGLLPLLAHLEAGGRTAALPVHVALGEERAHAVAEVWQRHWPQGFPVELDARRAVAFEEPPFLLTTVELSGGERVRDTIVGTQVHGLRIRTPDATVAYAPACRPGTTVERLLRGAALAVVTASRVPADTSPAQAQRLADAAPEGWVVCDGHLLGAPRSLN